jgi:protein SCO1/2
MKRFATLSVLLLAVALLGAGCGPYHYEGSLYDPPRPLSGFSLPEADGSTFNLGDYQGKVVLLYFGYSNCPDECPTTLADLKQVMQKLGGDATQVQVLFVTVDPERDTPDRLVEYLANFDSSFIGLRTTDSAQLQQVMSQFGAFAQVDAHPEGATDYEVSHSLQVFAIDRQGRLYEFFSYGTSADAITADVQHLLKQ